VTLQQCRGLEHADLRVIRCLRADVPAPGPGGTLADCDTCPHQVWLGADQRAVIAELEIRELDYVIRCYPCTEASEPPDTHFHVHNSSVEALRMRLARGMPPRSPLVVVSVAEMRLLRDIFGINVRWD
jgi:hypothetical protein